MIQTEHEKRLSIDHELIKEVVKEYDPHAELYLFGPGAKRPGKTVDLYIHSQKIDRPNRLQIQQRLNVHYRLTNIDRVCEANDPKNLETIQCIALAIE